MAKRTFRDYPEHYYTVLEDFSAKGKDFVMDGTYAEAIYTRHDLHRFFKALSAAAPNDPHAARLSNITRDIIITIEPPHTTRESPAKLYVKMNPLAKVMRGYNSQEKGS